MPSLRRKPGRHLVFYLSAGLSGSSRATNRAGRKNLRLAASSSVGRQSSAYHERDDRLTKRQAQRHKAAAITVMRTNQGSVAKCGPSRKTRQICATTSRPKTAPEV